MERYLFVLSDVGCIVARDGPIRIGLIGVGNLGVQLGEMVVNHPRAELVAISDVSNDALKRAGEELGVREGGRYLEHLSMLESERIDAVAIATPHAFHYEHARDAMDHGVHVYCEKPLAIDLDDACDLTRRAEEMDETFVVGYQRHHFPPFVRARERWVDDTREPQFVTAETTQEWLSEYGDTWRTDPDVSGGGQLYDTGNHLVDAVLWMTGLTPVSVSAEMDFDDAANRVDKHAMLSVRFDNGAVGNLSVSGDTRQRHERIYVCDEEGALTIRNQIELSEITSGGEERPVECDFSNHLNKAEAFVQAIETEAEPPATPRDALPIVALTEAAYESARTGTRIDVALPSSF